MISFFRLSWDGIIIKSVCFRGFSALVTASRLPIRLLKCTMGPLGGLLSSLLCNFVLA